ncbi:MAG TPA: YetF domain-containing protein [Mobilitalea sp.]|nr:YetF domain-containing protein [Mobilitalea sp.]
MDTLKSLLPIVFSSFCVYIFIVVAIRIFGKKDLAQLSVVDVVFVLLISNAVQNAMVGSNTSLLGGIVAATTLFITNLLFKSIVRKFPKLSNFIEGQAVMLIYDGNILEENMKKTGITRDEIIEAMREHGVDIIEKVSLAVLETDGNISIITDEFKTKTTKKRKTKKTIKQQN